MRSLSTFSRSIVACAGLFLACGVASAADIYISQSSGGANSGADCADAHSAAWFNTASNWGTASGLIGPGVTAHLCGTISTELATHGSGTASAPITILFQPGAMISLPACENSSGCLNLTGSYIIVDGGTPCGPSTACSSSINSYGQGTPGGGIIQQTANGTPPAAITNITCSSGVATVTGSSPFGFSLPGEPKVTIAGNSVAGYNGTWAVASNNDSNNTFTFSATCGGTGTGGKVGVLCPSGSYCSVQQGAIMIEAQNGCKNCEIRNLIVGPVYVRSSYQDWPSLGVAMGVYLEGCSGCTTKLHDTAEPGSAVTYIPVSSGDTGLQIYNNDLYGGGDAIVIAGSATGNVLSGAQIHDNYIHDMAVWDSPGCAAHLDGIHVWGQNGGQISGINFYNNWIGGSFGSCPTGAIFFEGYTTNNALYNNVINITYTQDDSGVVALSGTNLTFVNNTIQGDYNNDTCFSVGRFNSSVSFTPSITFENNIIQGCGTILEFQQSPTILAWDYNVYGDVTGAQFVAIPSGGASWNTFSNWQSLCSCDAHSISGPATDYAGLGTNGALVAGSPAVSAGINLTSLGMSALDSDTSLGDTRTPTARPGTGAWSSGAYNYSGGGGSGPPSPPTSLLTSVH